MFCSAFVGVVEVEHRCAGPHPCEKKDGPDYVVPSLQVAYEEQKRYHKAYDYPEEPVVAVVHGGEIWVRLIKVSTAIDEANRYELPVLCRYP